MNDSTIPLKRCTKCAEEFPATEEYFYVRKYNTGATGLNAQCRKCERIRAELKNRANGHKPHVPAAIKRVVRVKRVSLTPEARADALSLQSQGLKRCSKCHEVKPATAEYFFRRAECKDGLSPICKPCRRVERKSYPVDPEKEKARRKNYRERHRDSIRERNRESKRKAYAENPEKVREAGRRYLQNNRHMDKARYQRRQARKLALPNDWTGKDWLLCLEYWHYCCVVCGAQLRDLFGDVKPNADHWIALNDLRPDNPGTVPGNMLCLCSVCNNNKKTKDPEQWLAERYSKRKVVEIMARIQVYFEWIVSARK